MKHLLHAALLLTFAFAPSLASAQSSTTAPTILTAADAGKILPPSVYFRGQTAPIQARNSVGIRFSKDAVMLAALVDTSGYSSQVQEKYQAYLITETPLSIDGHRLAPGAYGVGFIAGNNFIVMDIGGHDLFTAHTTHDEALHRPSPLQILSADTPGHYRLYAGRNYVNFSQATN